MSKYRINIYNPVFVGNEKKYVNECLDDVWISGTGKFVNLFEENFAKYTGVKHAVSVCNGTVALHLALVALGIKEGDEVIVPTFTYIASVNSIAYCNATPVFVDSLESDWQLNPEDVKKKITSRTKAIMVPHLYGACTDMNVISKIAKENNLYLVEDAAEAFGTRFDGKHVGGFGDISTFSFFGNKTITCGEGGMVVTNNDAFNEKLRNLKAQGLAKNKEYFHDVIGYNYRMTNVTAAIGFAQLEKADEIIAKKRRIADLYRQELAGCEKVKFYPELKKVFNSYWMCSVLFESEEMKNRVRKVLDENGIETRPLFYPAHVMPVFSAPISSFPVAENFSKRGINLPSWIGLSDEDVKEIARLIISA